MIILGHKGETIKLNISDDMETYLDTNLKRICHKITLPNIICTDKADAKFIQKSVNDYVNHLCNDIIKNK